MDISKTMADLAKFGIDLKLESTDAEFFYSESMRQWFTEDKDYKTRNVKHREFTLIKDGEEAATVYIEDSVLRINPISTQYTYDVFLDVLEFVALHHKRVVEVFEYLNTNPELSDKLAAALLDEDNELSEPSSYEEGCGGVEEESEDNSDDWLI